MPMTSHSHHPSVGSDHHAHAPGKKGPGAGTVAAAVAAAVGGASSGHLPAGTGGVDKHHPKGQNQIRNPLHPDGERCKARVPAKVPLTEINQFLICQLCFGYLVDATAIIECQHAFCKSCILKYLENKNNSYCPICEVQLNEAKPHSSLRSDEILQKLVYKLVPGLFITEVRRRRDFLNKDSSASISAPDNNGLGSVSGNGDPNRSQNQSQGKDSSGASPPKNGAPVRVPVSVDDIIASMDMKEGGEDLVFLSPEDSVSLSLEYFKSSNTSQADEDGNAKSKPTNSNTNSKPSTGTERQQAVAAAQAAQKQSTENAENKRKNSNASSNANEVQNSNANANAIATATNAGANSSAKNTCSDNKANDRRYLQCPAAVSVGLLKKFIRMKYGLSDDYRVDLLYNGDRDSSLENELTLLDLALIFKWKKAEPMCFHYRIFDRPFKPTNSRPGSKRPFSSLMDHEPPNDGGAGSSGPPNKSPAPAKLTRFQSAAAASDGKSGGADGSGAGKTQPKNKSLGPEQQSEATKNTAATTSASESVKPKDEGMKFRALNVGTGGRAGLLNLEDAIEESKVKAKLSVDTKFSTGLGSTEQPQHKSIGGQKLSVVMPKVPPLIVSSPTRDPSSPLKISFGSVSTSTSPSSSTKSASASPEGKAHHHHHHHHHHKHHRHHKEKHRKHSKNKSKDRDREKGSGSSSSDKSKHKEKRKEEKAAKAAAAAAAAAAKTAGGFARGQMPTSSNTDTKEKETRYKYNAHPNPSQSQTISVKAGKFPTSLLTQAASATGNLSQAITQASTANMANRAPPPNANSTVSSIGKLENIVNKKMKNVTTGIVTGQNQAQPVVGALKKEAGIFPQRRASNSSTASTSSQASQSLNVSLKPKQGLASKDGKLNNIVLPDSVHLQVPKSVTLIPVNPNSGQVLGNNKQQQQRGTGNQQHQHQQQQGASGGVGGRLSNATTFTHPLTNKSLHQITVTEVPPPNSKSLSSSSSSISSSSSAGMSGHKQFNGPGSMEITKIYCDKSSSSNNSTAKVFDPQGKKLKGLDISISNANPRADRDRGSGEGQSKGLSLGGKTGNIPKIPGVSILPQSMAKSGKLPKNTISMHAMSISASGGVPVNRIKEKHMQPTSGGSNRLSITTIQQQQQQQSLLKIPKSGEMINRNVALSNALRRSSSPHSGSGSGTPPRKLQQQQQHQRVTPSPPGSKLSQLLSQSQEQLITAKMVNRRNSIEITPVSSMSGGGSGGGSKPHKIKRPFESTFSKNSQSSGAKQTSSPPGKREKLTTNSSGGDNQSAGGGTQRRGSECPLDLSGKSSRSTPPGSGSDYDSSNSSFSADRPSTPNISITATSPPNHKLNHSGGSSGSKSGSGSGGKSHGNVAHGTQTISSIAQTLTQKQQQQQQQHQQHHVKEQKQSNNSNRPHPGGLNLSPPLISPSSHHSHSPNSAASPVGSGGPGFHPLGNLLTLSNAAAHLRSKMNHNHNQQLSNLAAAAAASAGGFCPNLLRQPGPGSMLSQHSPSSHGLNSLASPPISPNAITSSGLLSHFGHHQMSQMSMSSLMNSPLMQMNSAAAAAAASLLDPTSPASLFCARMGFPQPNPSSPLNPNANSNPFFPSPTSLTRPPHSSHSPSSALRIPNVSNNSKGHTTKSPPISQPHKSHNHSPKQSSPGSGSGPSSGSKPLKVNGNMTSPTATTKFVAPQAKIQQQPQSQVLSAKSAIPNSMKISNFLPTTKSSSSNANATITSSCGDYESLLMTQLPLNEIGVKHEPRNSPPTTSEAGIIKSEPLQGSLLPGNSSVTKKVLKPSTNAKYVCLPGGIKLVSAKASSGSDEQVQIVANAVATESNHKRDVDTIVEDESTKLLSKQKQSQPKSEPQEQKEAVITKLHEPQAMSDSSGLGALGIALGLVPRERERERDDKEQVPLLLLTGTSSGTGTSTSTATTTTMSRTTQQQNLAVRHIPNPSLIFSRNTPANTNVTPPKNNQIPSPTPPTKAEPQKTEPEPEPETKTETVTENQLNVKDEGKDVEPDKANAKCMEKDKSTETPLPTTTVTAEVEQKEASDSVVHVKQEIGEPEPKHESASVAVAVEDDVKKSVTVEEPASASPIKSQPQSLSGGESSGSAEVKSEKCESEFEVSVKAAQIEPATNDSSEVIKSEDIEINQSVAGAEKVDVDNSCDNSSEPIISGKESNETLPDANEEPSAGSIAILMDAPDAATTNNEVECSEPILQTSEALDKEVVHASDAEGEDKIDAPAISFGFQLLEPTSAAGVDNRELCSPISTASESNDTESGNDKYELTSGGDDGHEKPIQDASACEQDAVMAMEIDQLELDTEDTEPEPEPDHENALVMGNDDDDDDEEAEEVAEPENVNLFLKEDSGSGSGSGEPDDEANSVGNRTTEDSTSCDDDDMNMEIDTCESGVIGIEGLSTETEDTTQESVPSAVPAENENEESTHATILSSVEELVETVENDNNNTIAVTEFPSFNLTETNMATDEEIPMEIETSDEVDNANPSASEMAISPSLKIPIPIPDIVVTDTEASETQEPKSETEPEVSQPEVGQGDSMSSLSPPPSMVQERSDATMQNGSGWLEESSPCSPLSPLPSVLALLSVVTTSPQSVSLSENSPSGSSRPNSLSIITSPSPIDKLAYLKSGSCSPVSPSSVKSGEHNLRKIENLEKVAAGLLATATNINNNTISATSPTTAAPSGTTMADTDRESTPILMTVSASENCDLTSATAVGATSVPVVVVSAPISSNSSTNCGGPLQQQQQQQQPPVSNV